MPILRAGQPVTFLQRQVTGVDDYGNDVYGTTSVVVSGCAISPGNTSEQWGGTAVIEADVTVHIPAAQAIDLPLDQFRTPDGTLYNVVGKPRQWESPFTGTGSMQEVLGRVVTTGGQAT